MHCKAFGHIANFDMHSLKQVYIYVMSVACMVWIKFKVLFGFEILKTRISSDLFYPEKPN